MVSLAYFKIFDWNKWLYWFSSTLGFKLRISLAQFKIKVLTKALSCLVQNCSLKIGISPAKLKCLEKRKGISALHFLEDWFKNKFFEKIKLKKKKLQLAS